MYIIIEIGYEGIDAIHWLTDSIDEALSKKKELQIAKVKWLVDIAYVLEDDNKLVVEPITDRHIQRAKNSIRIQKWDGSRFVDEEEGRDGILSDT